MERDILVEVNHPFIVKMHYGESANHRPLWPDKLFECCVTPAIEALRMFSQATEMLNFYVTLFVFPSFFMNTSFYFTSSLHFLPP